MCAHHHGDHHEHCGCAGHHHDQHEHCGCAGHHHDQHEHCGCAGDHLHCHGDAPVHAIFTDKSMNQAAADFMHLLHTHRFLPCARFLLKSEKEPSFSSVALAPVFLFDGEESVSFLRKTGEILLGLEYHGHIAIDYDLPLTGFDYGYFTQSKAYQLFQRTVAEGQSQPGFLGDIAAIECGSIAPLTPPEGQGGHCAGEEKSMQ